MTHLYTFHDYNHVLGYKYNDSDGDLVGDIGQFKIGFRMVIDESSQNWRELDLVHKP